GDGAQRVAGGKERAAEVGGGEGPQAVPEAEGRAIDLPVDREAGKVSVDADDPVGPARDGDGAAGEQVDPGFILDGGVGVAELAVDLEGLHRSGAEEPARKRRERGAGHV